MARVLFAGLFHETHCFIDSLTRLADFSVLRGAEILRCRGDGSQIDGFLEVAQERGWEIVPACAYAATPSATVEHAVFEQFWSELEPVARQAGTDGVDAIFVSLHGAMVTQSENDVEGEVLARLRSTPGLQDVPLFGVYDLHANFSDRMARHANGLVCYRENPHIDARDTAVRAARLLARCLETGVIPRMTERAAGILWSPPGTGTADAPMAALEAAARAMEAEDPDIWAVNIVGGYSFGDTPWTGVNVNLVGTADSARNAAILDQLCGLALALKERGEAQEVAPEEALAEIVRLAPDGPALLVEPSDNIGGGAPGNGTGVLRALMAADARDAGVAICDPEAVEALIARALGEEVKLEVGGNGNRYDPGPVRIQATLVSRSDGRFSLEDINSHLAASRGRNIEMGPCAVVRHRGITILLTSKPTPPFDLGQWRSQGIDPERLAIIGVKAAVAHRRAYDPIAAASFTVRTPGACTSDPRLLPYQNIRRPIYPLDPQ
ncbi:M81 family metallopeptidase [Pelagibacterium montanilacus]|uniref:M81 family metallopeptidase n=1 Tax=Pelagibacterium montanilacus TaxID=2185280 RepID=UPI001FE39759|nr:M81 family metallopeptidase [Pelagibacterium montanilacus]